MSRIYFDKAFGDLKGRAAQCLRGGVNSLYILKVDWKKISLLNISLSETVQSFS